MVKLRSSYQTRLNEALEEFNAWLTKTHKQESVKYCIKCRGRRALPGLRLCKRCNDPQKEIRKVQRVKNRRKHAQAAKPEKKKICNEPGCNNKYYAKGKCIKHYNSTIKRANRLVKKMGG